MGDPQAPFRTVLAVLEAHGLLTPDGRLREGVHLISMGDHFDFGAPEVRARATHDGSALLQWLSAHPPEQVTLLLGNHDLARVCELFPFEDDAAFLEAQAQATALYRGDPSAEALADFSRRYPSVPDPEALARDFSCFEVAQRELVERLLRSGRFRLAHARAHLLFVHAGVTVDDFAALGSFPRDAAAASLLLNDALDAAVRRWSDGPFTLEPLHQPGSARGIGRGVLFHRPAFPVEGDPQFAGPPRRRYDPRRLPTGFTQAIGHIRDHKARELLGPWGDGEAPHDGVLRSLQVDGDQVHYRAGVTPGARLIFLDAGMSHVAAQRYPLLDVDARRPLEPRPNVVISGT